MANGQIQNYANMVNLQMAAEAFWGNSKINFDQILLNGNKNNSKEPDSITSLFTEENPRFTLIAHQDLSMNNDTMQAIGTANVADKSGFSVSIFLDNVTGKYTLSIRKAIRWA